VPETGQPRPLPATAWAVLGLLSFDQELSGYDLKKWADNSLGFFYWSPATSQIYSELRRLEERGYVTSREAPQDDLRNKRLFRITPAGLDALRHWVQHAPVEPPVLKHGVALRVWLGHLADPVRLREIVLEHRAAAQATAERAARDAASAAEVPAWRYPAVVNAWAARYHRTQADLIDDLLADLDRLSAEEHGSRSGD
jgi:DNA-binding PadR family transcriptional regulator